jgi:hypothetical protein
MICHRYICDDLKVEISRLEPHLPAVLNAKFKLIQTLQRRLVSGEAPGFGRSGAGAISRRSPV